MSFGEESPSIDGVKKDGRHILFSSYFNLKILVLFFLFKKLPLIIDLNHICNPRSNIMFYFISLNQTHKSGDRTQDLSY